MAQQMRLVQKQLQKLSLTPQMQQALSFLQLPLMELRELIQVELAQNPVLEESEKEEPATSDSEEYPTGTAEPESKDSPKKSELEKVLDMNENWQEYYRGPSVSSTFSDQDKRSYMESLIVKPTTLQEHLLMQMRLLSSDQKDTDIGEYIIGNLDENGYLQDSIEEMAMVLNRKPGDVERVLSMIQAFDPLGVGARNLKECLMIQLRYNGNVNPLAIKIVEEHMEDLQYKRYPTIAKKLSVSVNQVQKAAEVIACLEPRPGSSLSQSSPQYVIPDVIIRKVGDEYVIIINDDSVSRFRISPVYKKMLKDPRTQQDTKLYIKEKLNSALWLLRAIQHRHQTIYKVTETLLRMQMEFMEKGLEYLRPLTLQQVASEIEMHESTVSRVITNKYIETPQGIFEMRHFFSGRLKTSNSETGSSSKSVKMMIKKSIETEDHYNPLSDRKLVEILAAKGVEVARRTVAKYREELKLLPLNMRRRFE